MGVSITTSFYVRNSSGVKLTVREWQPQAFTGAELPMTANDSGTVVFGVKQPKITPTSTNDAQNLSNRYPDLRFKFLHGNVDTQYHGRLEQMWFATRLQQGYNRP